MKSDGLIYALSALLIAVFLVAPVSAQEKNKPAAMVEGAVQPEGLSVYGEVQAVDPASNSISVQYYNYDTDEEKTMNVTLNKDTKMENASAIGDIKKGDWVDVMYAASGAKNVASSVVVEKEEVFAEEAGQETEMDMTSPVEE